MSNNSKTLGGIRRKKHGEKYNYRLRGEKAEDKGVWVLNICSTSPPKLTPRHLCLVILTALVLLVQPIFGGVCSVFHWRAKKVKVHVRKIGQDLAGEGGEFGIGNRPCGVQ